MQIPSANTTSLKGFAVFVGAVLVANYILSQIEVTRRAGGLMIGTIGMSGDE